LPHCAQKIPSTLWGVDIVRTGGDTSGWIFQLNMASHTHRVTSDLLDAMGNGNA
jgi:hypothetical protein